MDILIHNSSPDPIYAQIENQIKGLIMQDKLKEGDCLPSMRMLAKELRISLITTKRAYEELERDGFICTVAGKGSFVASKNLEILKEEHLKEVEGLLSRAISLSKTCGISQAEVLEMLKLLYKGD